jgi:hypothetical protein
MKAWQKAGVWKSAWEAILKRLKERGKLHIDETFLDATFRAAKKGATQSG